MKTKRIAWQVLLAALLVSLPFALKPCYLLWREIDYYIGKPTPAETAVREYAREMGIAYGEYPQSLIDLYGRNPETEAFVLNYPFREETAMDFSAWRDGDAVPLFLQWDPMWGYEPYGSDCIAVTGCGPTCLAMVGYYLTGDENMTPHQIAAFAEENGYYQKGYGSSWSLISQGGEELGFSVEELPLVKKRIADALEAGHPVILAVGEGDFTTTGHYIVLAGMEEGLFRVNDPNSALRSQQLWSYEQLEGQIRNIWAVSLPEGTAGNG